MADSFDRLLARARGGDRSARGALLERHLADLRAFVRLKSGRVVRLRESCSDLVQSVCRQVLEDLAGVECRGETAFRNWLFTVAERRISNKARYHEADKRAPSRETTPVDGSSVRDGAALVAAYGTLCTPSRHASAEEELGRIEAAMDALPPDYREVILQARLVGRSTADIAADLGRSEEAVRQLLSRARARLAILLHELRR